MIWRTLMFVAGLALAHPALDQRDDLAEAPALPVASGLTGARDAPRFAWVENAAGVRNVWVADTGKRARQVTGYTEDDGQLVHDVTLSRDGNQIAYVRGGDDEFPDDAIPNPGCAAVPPKQQVFALAALLALTALPAQAQTVLIQGARVFDGGKAPVRDVLVRGDRIVAVRRHVKPPADARIVDARGMTLIPGLHDLHIHTGSEAFVSPDALTNGYAAYLAAGVTSVNEYSVSGPMLAGIRGLHGAQVPHLQLAIRLGVPGGHGTESDFTNHITLQVTNPAEAHAAMAQALPYRPDLIKVFADGWRYDDPERSDRASMDEPTLAAIAADAHRAGIPVVTHTVTLDGAKIAARAGVDAVVHGIGDALADPELIRLMKRHRMAYVPTLVVYEPQEKRPMLAEDWLILRPRQRAREEEHRARPPEEIPAYEAKRWEIMRENVRRLHKAGIVIGVGTDTGIGGVYPGWAALREIRMLVELGFTPGQALTAATVTSARILGQARGHGRIRPGQRADLVLTGGKPDERISDLYDVRRVFVSGREVDLAALREVMGQ